MRSLLIAALSSCFLSSALAGSATWNLNPTNNDWSTAANWTPATVPNSATAVATFGVSNITDISFSASIQVSAIVFNPGASSFNLTLDPASAQAGLTLTISGAGITNSSGVTQELTADPTAAGHISSIKFTNAATAGDDTLLNVFGSAQSEVAGALLEFHNTASAGSAAIVAGGALTGNEADGGDVAFYNSATAANANVTVDGALSKTGFAYGGRINFFDSSSAADAIITINPGDGDNGGAGEGNFWDEATAANATFTVAGASNSGESATVSFNNTSTAGNSLFNVNGGSGGNSGGNVAFFGNIVTGEIVTAGTATFINNGGNGAGSLGGSTSFYDDATASQARLVANGGENGGAGGDIRFIYTGDGDEAEIEVYGNGHLDVSIRNFPGVTVGSLAGDGLVNVASRNLTIGSNDLTTTFSGVIEETGGSGTGTGGSVTKIGAGTLTLSGINTYTGGTTVLSGALKISNIAGSGTGSGKVAVNGGTLSGGGIIAGAVTIGTGSGSGAFLAPAAGGTTPSTLTIQGVLTFQADATYQCVLQTKKLRPDQVSGLGVTIKSGAQFKLQTVAKKRLSNGQSFVVINNTSASQISGTFANLPDGATINSGNNHFQVDYEGGDGNDLALTVVP